MAAGEGVCPFPLPPNQYYALYTDENVAIGNVPKPPPPIEGTYSMFGASFEVFELETSMITGRVFKLFSVFFVFLLNCFTILQSNDSIIQPLETQGITRLYPQHRRLGMLIQNSNQRSQSTGIPKILSVRISTLIIFIKFIDIHDPRTTENHYHDSICIYHSNFVLICIKFMLEYLGQIQFYFQC